jgi:hypothetical protein
MRRRGAEMGEPMLSPWPSQSSSKTQQQQQHSTAPKPHSSSIPLKTYPIKQPSKILS